MFIDRTGTPKPTLQMKLIKVDVAIQCVGLLKWPDPLLQFGGALGAAAYMSNYLVPGVQVAPHSLAGGHGMQQRRGLATVGALRDGGT